LATFALPIQLNYLLRVPGGLPGFRSKLSFFQTPWLGKGEQITFHPVWLPSPDMEKKEGLDQTVPHLLKLRLIYEEGIDYAFCKSLETKSRQIGPMA
jgi:hypothetical protein